MAMNHDGKFHMLYTLPSCFVMLAVRHRLAMPVFRYSFRHPSLVLVLQRSPQRFVEAGMYVVLSSISLHDRHMPSFALLQ